MHFDNLPINYTEVSQTTFLALIILAVVIQNCCKYVKMSLRIQISSSIIKSCKVVVQSCNQLMQDVHSLVITLMHGTSHYKGLIMQITRCEKNLKDPPLTESAYTNFPGETYSRIILNSFDNSDCQCESIILL